MQLNTNLNIDTSLCGKVVNLKEGYAEMQAFVSQKLVFEGDFTTFVLDSHVLG